MIRTADLSDLPALRALLARANDAPYDLAAVAEEKCFGDGFAGPPTTRVFERDGAIAGVAVTCGKYLRILAVQREARRSGIGSALLADAESRGAHIVAAEAGNYFTPGVVEGDEGTRAFFRERGYVETAWTWNLHVDLECGGDAAALESGGDAAALQTFLEENFGRIWAFEVSRARKVFVTEGEITGFAAIEANNRGLGTFGPTGVARSMRGRGLGRELLRAALGGLAEMGFTRAVIPWTDALDYYRKACGARPAHRFVALERAQAIDSAP